ncbi:MAG: hypothetical protein R3C59_05675 [Planctomycetaceae bacterium]
MMIDNKQEAHDLIQALNRQLPMRAYATPQLIRGIRGKEKICRKVGDPVTIDSVVYLEDAGGIACTISRSGGKTVFVVSITHLTFDEDHPLFEQIQAYQNRRNRRLAESEQRDSNRSPAALATKPGRQRTSVAQAKKELKAELDRRFRPARSLWKSGKYERAADGFRNVIEFDDNDPTFSRYFLASCLFQLELTSELDDVLSRHDDQSGIWRFAQALHAFQQYGDTEESQRLLVEADLLEPGFEDYLLGGKTVDASREVRFDAGADRRAFGCARLFLPAWRNVPGAASWARRVLKTPSISAESEQTPRRFPQDELRTLPQSHETWQVGLMLCENEPSDHETPMWLFCVANVDGQEMRVATVIDQPLTETVAWNSLIESFLSPMEGESARPETIVVGRREYQSAWKPLFDKIGIRCRYEHDPQPVGQLLQAMGNVMERPALPPVAEIDIREFPQSDAVWQADFFRSPMWVSNEQEGEFRPWSALVLDRSRSAALHVAQTSGGPDPEMLLEVLVHAMTRPAGEPSQRPRMVEVADSDCYDYLKPRLEAAGVDCRLVDELSEFNDFCLGFARSCDGAEKCALADGKGVTKPQMESFYEAAAYYFRRAPWKHVPGEIPIEIRCDSPDIGTRYAIVMGRTGVQLGLCIYDDWKALRAILNENSTRQTRAIAVCYDEPQIMAAVDLQLVERFGWPIATSEAWPAVMKLEPRRTPRSVSGTDLVFLDACLRAIPDFLQGQSASIQQDVMTGTDSVQLHMAWKPNFSR